MFKRKDLEDIYSNTKDSAFKFYVAYAFLIFILMVAVQLIQLST
jgi:hypothetical protein